MEATRIKKCKFFKGHVRISNSGHVLGLLLTLYCIAPSSAVAVNETYDEAIAQAIGNAGNAGTVSSTWLAAPEAIININSSDTHSLQYDSGGNVIVRTASTYGSFLTPMYIQNNYTYRSDKLPTDDNAAWVTAGKDATRFLDENSATASTAVKLIERGLGINDTGTHTVMVEYAVSPDNDHLMRPTKNPDIATYNPSQYGNSNANYPFVQPSGMSGTSYSNFQTFYAAHTSASYGPPGTFPYTQLGYTYFWGNGSAGPIQLSQIYGMSEFIILPQTKVNIYAVYSMQSYMYTKNKNGSFSTDSDAQYGNGFASFNITGDCDTVWAGHRFQAQTSHSASDPNQITVGGASTISGGQGLLIWSLNYLINNSGTITTDGATKKFFIDGTESIAILFTADTSASYGTPVTSGINEVINSGVIKGTAAGGGTGIKIEAGDTIIQNSGTISGTTAIAISGGTTAITNTGTINGNLVLTAGTTAALDVGTGNVALSAGGAYIQGSGTALELTANSASNYGKVTTSVASTLAAASTVNVTIDGYMPNNTMLTVVDTSGAGIGSLPGTITASSPLIALSGSDATGDLVLTATRANSYNSFASNSNAAAAGTVLNSIAVGGNPQGDMLTVLSNLDSMNSAAQIDQALNTLTPNTDNSVPQTTQMTQDQFIATALAHLDGFKNVIRDFPKGFDLWASGFGSYLHQDARAASNGYNAAIWGTAIGGDLPALDHLRIGMAGGFAQDFIRTKDSSSRTDIDSYQGTLYASYAKDAYYIDTIFSFAYNSYDTSRHVALGALDRTATGDYNGQQYSGYIQGGYKFISRGIELTPIASFLYSHLRLNGYAEEGAGALSLKVDAQDYDIAQTGLGIKAGYPFDIKSISSKITPELKFKWLYDWVGEAQQSTSAFTGGGGSFNTQGFTPAQSSYDFGAKVTFETDDTITISISYDLELKEDFYGHYGYANIRYRF